MKLYAVIERPVGDLRRHGFQHGDFGDAVLAALVQPGHVIGQLPGRLNLGRQHGQALPNALFVPQLGVKGRAFLQIIQGNLQSLGGFANREEINEIYTEWFDNHTQAEAIESFARENGTLAPIYSVAQIFEDPQFAAREAIVPVQDDDFGEVRLQAVVPKLSNNPGKVRHTARSLGADNMAVYEEYLDLSADEVAALQEKGII